MKSVLWVEDNVDFVESIKANLKNVKYDITFVYTQKEYFEQISEKFFDVILSDFVMPVNGVALLKSAKERCGKLYIVSEFDVPYIWEQCRESGVRINGVFPKSKILSMLPTLLEQ